VVRLPGGIAKNNYGRQHARPVKAHFKVGQFIDDDVEKKENFPKFVIDCCARIATLALPKEVDSSQAHSTENRTKADTPIVTIPSESRDQSVRTPVYTTDRAHGSCLAKSK